MTNQDRRKNGWELPPHPLQVVTWFLFPTIVLQFYLFLMPLLWNSIAQIILSILFGLAILSSSVAVYLTCAIDPCDNALTQGTSSAPADDADLYCYLCEVNVHSTSKHCRFCDKCVLKFDHHCKWLNTCIGQKNYRYFLLLVASIGLMTTTSLVLASCYLVEIFYHPDSFNERIHDAPVIDQVMGRYPVMGLIIISVTALLPLVALVYQLGGFHTMLVYRGVTTYDFIVSEQKRQREAKQAKLNKKKQKKLKKAAKKSQASNDSSAATLQDLPKVSPLPSSPPTTMPEPIFHQQPGHVPEKSIIVNGGEVELMGSGHGYSTIRSHDDHNHNGGHVHGYSGSRDEEQGVGEEEEGEDEEKKGMEEIELRQQPHQQRHQQQQQMVAFDASCEECETV